MKEITMADERTWQELAEACRELKPSAFYTANRVKIEHGLRVWDYDVRPGSVDFEKTFAYETPEYWDGWFNVKVDGTSRHSLMNGERTTTYLPYKGTVPPAPVEADR